MRFVRASESADRRKSVPREDARWCWTEEGDWEGRARRNVGGGRRKKRLSPFFLFGVAIERVGDQVVDTCSASPSITIPSPPPPSLPSPSTVVDSISCWFVGICLSRFSRSAGPSLLSKMVSSRFLLYISIFARLLISRTANRSPQCARRPTDGWYTYN